MNKVWFRSATENYALPDIFAQLMEIVALKALAWENSKDRDITVANKVQDWLKQGVFYDNIFLLINFNAVTGNCQRWREKPNSPSVNTLIE